MTRLRSAGLARTGLAILCIAAPLAFAKPGGPEPQLPPCMPVDEMRMTHVVHVPQWPNFLLLRKEVDRKFGGKTILAKLPAAEPATIKAKKKPKRVQVCKRFSKKKKRCTWLIWVTK